MIKSLICIIYHLYPGGCVWSLFFSVKFKIHSFIQISQGEIKLINIDLIKTNIKISGGDCNNCND